MRATLMKKLRTFRSDDEGVTLVEYGIALVLAVVVGTTALINLANITEASVKDACGAAANGTGANVVALAGTC